MLPDEIQYKAVRGAIQRAGRAAAGATRKGKKTTRVARSAADRPQYDGDNDGFITNPLTGEDDIPWDKTNETAEEAIAKFFSQRGSITPQRRETVGEIAGSATKPQKAPAPQLDGPTSQRMQDVMRPMRGGKPLTPGTPPTPLGQNVNGRMLDIRWPKNESGKLVEVSQLTEADLGHNLKVVKQLLDDIANGRVEGGSGEIVKQLEKLQQDMSAALSKKDDARLRQAAREVAVSRRVGGYLPPGVGGPEGVSIFGDQRSFDFDDFAIIGLGSDGPRWNPDPRWKSRRSSRHSWLGDNAVVEEALDGTYISVEVVDAISHDADREGYILVGQFYDVDSQSWDTWDMPDIVHNSVEDAMKFAEDLEDAVERQGVSPYDPDFEMPNPNPITDKPVVSQTPWKNAPNSPAKSKVQGRLGQSTRSHSYVPPLLEEARRLFAEKWFDRRRNAELLDNIEFARDRLRELELLYDRMGDDYANQFPGMDEAWNMGVEEFARWALRAGIVDSLTEGRNYHAEVMDAWDQMAEDQQELGQMMSEIRDSLNSFTEKLNSKIEQNSPYFEGMETLKGDGLGPFGLSR